MDKKITLKEAGYQDFEWDVASFFEGKTANNMELGNICVIGEEGDVFGLVAHLTIYFKKLNHHLELFTPEQFLRRGRSNDFNNQHYLIHIEPVCVSGNRIGVITDYCNITFISRISPVISVVNRIKYNRILGGLGGNFSKRKTMLASLKQNEFLVIGKNNEKVLNLQGGVENE